MPSLMLVPLAVSEELKQTHRDRQTDRITLYILDIVSNSLPRSRTFRFSSLFLKVFKVSELHVFIVLWIALTKLLAFN